MNTEMIVDRLNDILRWEWRAVIQYTQASFLVQDVWRSVYEPFFRKAAAESMEHVRHIGNKIVALGGRPTVEFADIHQAIELHEMLQQALDVEQGAVRLYTEALDMAAHDTPLRVLLESILMEEQEGVEHLERLLGTSQLVGAGSGRPESYARSPR
jgi:bacterioferritin